MNIPRFTLPATLAAAFHAVLLSVSGTAVPHRPADRPSPPTIVHEIPLDDLPVPPPSETEPVANNDVKPLKGDPPPIELAEPLAPLKAAEFTIAKPEPVPGPASTLSHLPDRIGDPLGDEHGKPNLRPGAFIAYDQLDRKPQPTAQVSPVYPATLKGQGIEGSVEVEFDVDVTGRVVSARVLKSSDREFEAATLRAVMKWRFEPGRRDGRAVPFRMVVPVNFSLNDA